MIFGLIAGEMLRGPRTPRQKTFTLLWTGALCLALGLAMDPRMVVPVPLSWTVCPIVKRIWTPSWVLFSSGWTLWMLAAFYWIIDVKGWKSWAFPLAIVGMNSIAMYVGAQLLKPWIAHTLRTHFGAQIFDYSFGPVAESAAVLFVLWLMCLWMYRRKIFIRI
jgi:predicted acyltransferase